MHRILAVIYHNCGQAPYSGVSVHKHTLHTLHTLHTHTTQREEPKSHGGNKQGTCLLRGRLSGFLLNNPHEMHLTLTKCT